jgi:spermidine synthase
MAITISEERGVRYLHFGSPMIQGAMRIARPWSLELDYTRAMMMPLLFNPEPRWPRRSLQIGLGAASITKFLHRHKTHSKLTVVEIAPEVVTAAWQFFHLPDDPKRLTVEIDDGHAYTSTVTRRFNLIIVDGFDAKGRAGMLDSVLFYRNCRARLSDDGVIAINLLSRRRGAEQSIERIRDAFDDRVLALPPCDAGNIVALAVVGSPVRISFDELRAAAQKLKAETALNLLPLLARLATTVTSGNLVL